MMLDVAVAYRRYQFVGDEFLTWLWYIIEKDARLLKHIDQDIAALEIGNRMVFENRYRKDSGETVTIKGEEANMDEGLLALKKGAMVTEANLVYRSGDQEWRFNLKGESLNLSSLRVPEIGKIETREDIEGAVIEKIYLCEKIINLINGLFKNFIKLRVSNEWSAKTVPAIRKWIVSS
jgi:hypothetical protein